MFFFEKKNQKTFICFGRHRIYLCRLDAAGNLQKFFASFFSKKKSLACDHAIGPMHDLNDAVAHQRAFGVLRLDARRAGARTRLEVLRQEGCLRACFPRADAALQAVLLNTAGGVTDGDVLATSLAAGPGAQLVVATQAAERIYRARAGAAPARVQVQIDVAAAARCAYLPQETILFDGSALARTLRIDLAPDSLYLGVETLLFGRAAMGEVLREIHLRDTVQVRRAGRLVLHDAIRLRGGVTDLLQRRATAGGAGAIASLLYAAPDAASRLAGLREAMAGEEVTFGASVRDALLMLRMVGVDGRRVRRAVLRGLAVLRDGLPLPRVWSC